MSKTSRKSSPKKVAAIIGVGLLFGAAALHLAGISGPEPTRANESQDGAIARRTSTDQPKTVGQHPGDAGQAPAPAPGAAAPLPGAPQAAASISGQGTPQRLRSEFLGIPVLRVREATLDRGFLIDPLPMPGESLTIGFFDDVSVSAEVRDIATTGGATESLTATIPGAAMGRMFVARTGGQVLAVANFPGQNKQFRLVYDAALARHFAVEVDVSRLVAESPVDSVIPPDPGPPVAGHEKLVPNRSGNAKADASSRKDPAVFAAAQTFEDESPAGAGSSPADAFEDPEQNITIDLMVVYTPAALAQAGNLANMQNAIAVAIAESNDVHFNSRTGVSLRLVHSAQTTYTESGNGQLSDELSRLSSQSDGYMDEIHALRNTYQADIVQLVSHENGGGGIAYQLTSFSGSPSWAFSVSNYNSLVGVLTPVHEIGHNMGCGHAIDQNYQAGPGIASYAGGWHWHPVAGQSGYCTIMAYTSGTYYADALSHSRVPYFSNPDIFLDGLAVGDTDDANNARAIRLTKRVMAEYRAGENFVPVVNTNLGLSVRPAIPATITPANLQASDANGRDTPEVLTFTLVSVPGKGLLKRNSTQLLVGHSFTQQDIDDGIITFTGGSGQTGTDAFVFNLKDSANAGVEGVVVAIQFDTAPPVLTGTSPAHNSGTQPRSSSLQVLFDESVLKGGTGTLVLRRQADHSVVESVNITSSQVAVSGNSVIYTPSVTLDYDTGYYLEIPTAGTITDRAGNLFAGFTGSGVFAFKTVTTLTTFAISAIGASQTSGTPFAVTLTAKNPDGATDTAFTGTGRRATLALYAADTLTLGSGTSSTTSFLSVADQERREEIIYLQSEVGAAKTIYGIALYASSLGNPSLLQNFTVRLAHTNLTTFSTTSVENSALQTCYRGNMTFSPTGWVKILFSEPFSYDGTSHLLVSLTYDNPSNGTTNGGFLTYSPGGYRRMYKSSTTDSTDPVNWATLQYVSTSLPQIQFFSRGAALGLNPTETGDFTAGVWTGNLTALTANASAVVFATINGAIGSSNAFAISAPAVQMNVKGNGTTIPNGDATPGTTDHTDFGTVTVGSSLTRTFTIENAGTQALTINGSVALSGPGAAAFSVTVAPAASVAGSASTTFQIRFAPASTGLQQATVSISSNDPQRNPCTFSVQGTGYSSYSAWSDSISWGASPSAWDADPDADGLNNLAEHALFLNPVSGGSATGLEAGTESEGATNYLTLTFQRNRHAAGVRFVVESSADLSVWTDSFEFLPGADITPAPDVSVLAQDADTQTVRVRVPVASGRRFLRLSLTTAPGSL